MYNLHSLGWYNFQQLCHTVLTEILGQTVEMFLDSNDAGKDGGFSGIWNPNGLEDFAGKFVFQCKFTASQERKMRPSDLKDEVIKARNLVNAGRCDVYILISNYGISGAARDKIAQLFLDIGVRQVAVFGSTWLDTKIRENKNLRIKVPRLYGLGDLSQILDERAYAQARHVLESLKPELAKVVITSAYKRALKALQTHNFVLLIGEPAAGKTTIALLLAMAALDQWDILTLKVKDADGLVERWNPKEPSGQFFWIDDVFGPTQYESPLAQSWNRNILEINAIIGNGNKIVLTSRDYVFNEARQALKGGHLPLLNEMHVVIDVRDLSVTEKKQILYNHLKLGKQPLEFKTSLKPFLEQIASNNQFIPEIARRLSNPLYTKKLIISDYHLREFVEKPEEMIHETIQSLHKDHKAALALIYMRNDELSSPIELNDVETDALSRMGSTIGECRFALDYLKDSFVQLIAKEDGSAFWKFKHPTIADAFSVILRQSPELIEIYLRGTNVDKLLRQVTCGDVSLQNAVIIGPKFFPLFKKRIENYSQTDSHKDPFYATWHAKRNIQNFLSTRCSKQFLAEYIAENKDVFDEILAVRPTFQYSPEIDLLLKLFSHDLLPEEVRQQFVQKITAAVIAGEDYYAIENPTIQVLIKPEEKELLDKEVIQTIPTNISKIRLKWESKPLYSWETVKDKMAPLLSSMNVLKERYGQDEHFAKIITDQLEEIDQYIEKSHVEKEKIPEREIIADINAVEFKGGRSIFEDIDQD
jgi:hypothetical protein